MDLPIFFGEWLKRRRKALDLTQAELGQRAGCSVFTLRKIEAGERRPSKQLAHLLARALEIPPEQEATFVRVARGELLPERMESSFSLVKQGAPPSIPTSPIRHNLPRSLTSFIGRSAELSAMGQLLHDPYCRVLTLVGPGGIGKTRLAIEFASQQIDKFPDGVFFVSLAPLSSPMFFVPAIADVLGMTFQGQSEPKTQLLNYLRGKRTLLVLDNIEHLLSGVDLFVEYLERLPNLKLLVTSRELLNLKGEWVIEIQGLPVPPLSEVDRAQEFSAVALFQQCARRVKADFDLKEEDRLWVVKICRILDGVPLGIELAGAWVRILSCQEIYSEIENSLDFLSTPARDVPVRHQSMRAVFEQSWRILNGKEQRAMAKLSVFRGGFRRDAAEQVAGADLMILSSLTSKSLIRRTQGDRYDIHELLRQFVAHKLHENPDDEIAARDCHSAYYLKWIRESEPALMSQRQKELLAEMTPEISNLRCAWEWAVHTRQIALLEATAWPIYYLHELRSLFSAGERIFLQAARRIEEETGPLSYVTSFAYLEAFRGYLAARQGKVTEACQILKHCIEVLAEDDQAKYAIALLFSGIVLRYTGDSQKAALHLRKAHLLAGETRQAWIHCASAVMVGVAEQDLGDFDESKQWLEKGLNLSRVVGEPAILAYAISSRIQTASAMGDIGEVEPLLEEGLRLSAEAGHHFTRAMLLEQWARLSFAAGDMVKAKSMGQESIGIFRELNDLWHLSRALKMMGAMEMSSGDAIQAGEKFIEVIEIALQDHLYPHAFEALLEIAAEMKHPDDIPLVLRLASLIQENPSAAAEVKERASQLATEMKNRFPPQIVELTLPDPVDQPIEPVVKEILRKTRLNLEKNRPS